MILPFCAHDARTGPVRHIFVALILIGVIGVLGGCESRHDSSNSAQSAQLSSIDVGPPDSNVPAGLVSHFTATGIFSDGSKQDISTQVAWSSMNTAVASIGNSGVATTVNPGATTIVASLGRMTGSTSLTVTPAVLVSIGVTPTNPSIASGLTEEFRATGIYSDNTAHDLTGVVTWSSMDATVASVGPASNISELVTTLGPGSTTITASLNGVSGSTPFTVTAATLVSIGVTPVNSTVAKGLTTALKASGSYSDHSIHDLTAAVSWSSSISSVAAVSNASGSAGLTTALASGSTTITAILSGVSGSTALTVSAAALVSIGVTPTNPSLAKGLNSQFAAMGTYTDNSTQNLSASALWSSSDATTASISNAPGFEGRAMALNTGTVTITATMGTIQGSSGLTVTSATLVSIAITPTNPSLANGTTQQLTATGSYTDNSTQNLTAMLSWSSSNVGVADVSNAAGSNGLVTSSTQGSTTIGAALGSIAGSTSFTVTAAKLVSLAVIPTNPSIANGTQQQFLVTGTYTDHSTQDLTSSVNWDTSDSSIASLSNAAGSNGLASTLTSGSVTVTAALGGISGSTGLTVTPAALVSIAVIAANPSIANGTNQQFAATGNYSDGSTQSLTAAATWNSSDISVATISNVPGSNGLANTVAQGSVTITATSGGVSGSTGLTVTPATLVSIAVTPGTVSIASLTKEQFTATGTYTDASTQNLTAAATWTSSNLTVAKISNAAGSNGLAAGGALGQASISAALGGIASPAATLSVTAAPEYAFVTNQNSNSVSSFSIGAGGALTLVGTVAAGGEPNAVVADPTGRYLYVANWSDGTISEYAVGSGGALASMGTIAAGSEPASITLDTTGQYFYVANLASDTVSEYAIGAGGALTALGNIAAAGSPISVSADPASHYLYVADETGNLVSEYSIGVDGLLTSIGSALTGNNPQSVTVDPSGRYAYVANYNDATVSEYAINGNGTLTPIGGISSGSCPESVSVDPSGRYVYVENWCSNTVSEYSIGAGGALSAIGTVPTGSGPWFITIDPTGSDVYVADFNDSTVSEYTIGTSGALTAIGTAPTASGPNAITANY